MRGKGGRKEKCEITQSGALVHSVTQGATKRQNRLLDGYIHLHL